MRRIFGEVVVVYLFVTILYIELCIVTPSVLLPKLYNFHELVFDLACNLNNIYLCVF